MCYADQARLPVSLNHFPALWKNMEKLHNADLIN